MAKRTTPLKTRSGDRRNAPTPGGKGSSTPAERFARIRDDHATELAEDYLEMIEDLIEQAGEARAADLARGLGVSHVTVTKAIARLQRDGYVNSDPYQPIHLTPSGRRVARAARQRHELVVRFLRAIGVPAKDAATDAEGIEHHLSPATLSAMRRFLRGPAD